MYAIFNMHSTSFLVDKIINAQKKIIRIYYSTVEDYLIEFTDESYINNQYFGSNSDLILNLR